MTSKTELINVPELLVDQYEFDYTDNYYDSFEVTSNKGVKTFVALTGAIRCAQNLGMENGIVTIYGIR